MSAVVNPRGQITVDREIRARLDIRPGMVAVQQAVGNQLIVTFIPAPHNRSVAGILGKPRRRAPRDWSAVRDAAEQAIADDVR
jgi:hypothetical protein